MDKKPKDFEQQNNSNKIDSENENNKINNITVL